MDKVKYEVKKLVQAGYLLVDDIEYVCSQASDRYEHVFDTND